MFAKNDRFLGCIFAKKWPNSRNETKKNVNFPKIKNTSDESPFFFPKVCFNLPPKILFSLFFLKPRCEKWKFVMKPVKSENLLWNHEVKVFIFWNYCGSTRFLDLFYGKNEVSAETSLIFIFYCGTVSRETGEKMVDFFLRYLGIKNETGWWFHDFKRHKIMKPPDSVGKKK